MFDMLVAENLVDLIEEEGLRRSFSRVRAIRLRIGALHMSSRLPFTPALMKPVKAALLKGHG